jgi:hypothetical protein
MMGKWKLRPKFFGPFKVLEHVGDVAYLLELPVGAKLHDVFHVGLLKQYCGEEPAGPGTLPTICHGCARLEPAKVIKSHLAQRRHEVLV